MCVRSYHHLGKTSQTKQKSHAFKPKDRKIYILRVKTYLCGRRIIIDEGMVGRAHDVVVRAGESFANRYC